MINDKICISAHICALNMELQPSLAIRLRNSCLCPKVAFTRIYSGNLFFCHSSILHKTVGAQFPTAGSFFFCLFPSHLMLDSGNYFYIALYKVYTCDSFPLMPVNVLVNVSVRSSPTREKRANQPLCWWLNHQSKMRYKMRCDSGWGLTSAPHEQKHNAYKM